MKKHNLISLIIILLILIFNNNVQSQITTQKLCSECKIKAAKKRGLFSEEKYKSTAGFMYDLKYHRMLFVIDPGVRHIKGEITSYFVTKKDNFSEISFDLCTYLTTDSVKYHNSKLIFSHTNNEITATLANSLPVETLDSITVYYHGIPDETRLGSFTFDQHNGIPVAWSLSEPYGARDWWACKQSLDDKIDSIDIYISHPDIYKAASNGILISENSNSGTTITHWRHKHLIPAYLIAIAVTNYTVYSDYVTLTTGETVEVQNYVFPENLYAAKSQTSRIGKIMKLFSDLFIPYPYKNEKYGHAQMGRGGGMEHTTITFMGGFDFHLMAHELAHQWFGNYVTCGSWQDIWLNEAFATYFDGITVEHRIDDGSRYSNFIEWKKYMSDYITSEPGGSVFVADTSDVSRIFNYRLSYCKAAMVMHMLRKKLGDDIFFQALKNYLNDPELSNGYAVTADLQNHIEAVAGISIQEFLNDWFFGEGYPVYTIEYSQKQDKSVNLIISQNQSHSSVDFFDMKVPVKFYGTNIDTTIYFNNSSDDQVYNFSLDFKIQNAVYDPKKDIISTGSTIINTSGQSNNSLSIQPNPANNQITVTTIQNIGNKGVLIYNLAGELVKKYHPPSNTFYNYNINISDLNNGVYFLKIDVGGEFVSKKFVKFAE